MEERAHRAIAADIPARRAAICRVALAVAEDLLCVAGSEGIYGMGLELATRRIAMHGWEVHGWYASRRRDHCNVHEADGDLASPNNGRQSHGLGVVVKRSCWWSSLIEA